MTLIETKRAQLAGRIAGLNVPTGQHKARQAALTRLNAMGMPNKRDEYWRYTDPADLIGALALPVTGGEARNAAPMFDKLDALKIVFVDGVLDRDASDDLAMAGVRITLLSGADTASDLYGVLEETGQNPVARPLASFNTAFATEGVLIHVLKPVRRPVSIIYTSKTATSDAILHHCIKVDPGASLTLLEAGTLAARANLVLEVDLGEGAALHHIRDQGTGHLRQLVTHIFARLDRKALFKSFTLTTNGRLTRNEAVIDLLGDDGQAHLAGAALGDGPFHHDDTVFDV